MFLTLKDQKLCVSGEDEPLIPFTPAGMQQFIAYLKKTRPDGYRFSSSLDFPEDEGLPEDFDVHGWVVAAFCEVMYEGQILEGVQPMEGGGCILRIASPDEFEDYRVAVYAYPSGRYAIHWASGSGNPNKLRANLEWAEELIAEMKEFYQPASKK